MINGEQAVKSTIWISLLGATGTVVAVAWILDSQDEKQRLEESEVAIGHPLETSVPVPPINPSEAGESGGPSLGVRGSVLLEETTAESGPEGIEAGTLDEGSPGGSDQLRELFPEFETPAGGDITALLLTMIKGANGEELDRLEHAAEAAEASGDIGEADRLWFEVAELSRTRDLIMSRVLSKVMSTDDIDMRKKLAFLTSTFPAHAESRVLPEIARAASDFLDSRDAELAISGASIAREFNRLNQWDEVSSETQTIIASRLENLASANDSLASSFARESLAAMGDYGETYALSIFEKPIHKADGYTQILEHVATVCSIFNASPRVATSESFLEVGIRLGDFEEQELRRISEFYDAQVATVLENVRGNDEMRDLSAELEVYLTARGER